MPDTTPTYGLPFPEATDPTDVPGDIEALAVAVETTAGSIDDRVTVNEASIASLEDDTGWVTAGFAPHVGFSTTVARFRVIGGTFCTLDFNIQRTGATISGGTTGNIPDTPLLIVPEGARPAAGGTEFVFLQGLHRTTWLGYMSVSTGSISVAAVGANTDLENGLGVQGRITYLLL